MQQNVSKTDRLEFCLQSSLDSRQHHSDNWVKAKFNWINPFFLTQPLLISENRNILVLFLLRKYFAWYFQKSFCQLITKIILPDIVHNCSYSWRNRFLVLVKNIPDYERNQAKLSYGFGNIWRLSGSLCGKIKNSSFWISSTESQIML